MNEKSQLHRRAFLGSGAALASAGFSQAESGSKFPYRILYSNDLTNCTSCVSPWHKAREPFRLSMLEAAVDEAAAAGTHAQLLQPGLGDVPLWPSKVLPLEEHYRFIKETYGVQPDSYGKTVLAGQDLVKTFLDRCRKREQGAFLSLRLNDVHHKEYADAKAGEKVPGSVAMAITRFHREHPECRIGTDQKPVNNRTLNWMVPQVRERKLALVRELCENYDLDGLELDFLRFPSFFPPKTTTREDRTRVITSFVKDVRTALDQSTHGKRRRWLCARVPCYVSTLDPLGLDLPALVAAGLDVITLSASYFTTQTMEVAAIRKQVPTASLHVELCHSLWNGPKGGQGYDSFPFRRATVEQMQTTAHLGYARGADGVALFNFAYYRQHGSEGRGEFSEPPFDRVKSLGDPAGLAKRPQHFFLAPGWKNPFSEEVVLPRTIEPGKPAEFALDLAQPAEGWKRAGRMRLQIDGDHGDRQWSVSFNSRRLESAIDVSEPYPNSSPTMLGKPEALRAWSVPAALIKDGVNRVEITLDKGESASAVFLDLELS